MSRASTRLYSNLSEHRSQPSTFGQDKTSRGRVPYLRDTTWSTHFGRVTINKILLEIAAFSFAVFSFHMKIATVTLTTRLSSSNCTAFPPFLPPLPPWPGRIRLRPCSPLLPVSPPTARHITGSTWWAPKIDDVPVTRRQVLGSKMSLGKTRATANSKLHARNMNKTS